MNLKNIVIIAFTLMLVGCHSMEPSPVAPSPTRPAIPTPVITSYAMDAFWSPKIVSGGGATQIHVTIWGYDMNGIRYRIPNVPVTFTMTSSRAIMRVLSDHTDVYNDAVALLDVGPTGGWGPSFDYNVPVNVETTDFGIQTLSVHVCNCPAPPSTPSPSPIPSPTPSPIPSPTPSPSPTPAPK